MQTMRNYEFQKNITLLNAIASVVFEVDTNHLNVSKLNDLGNKSFISLLSMTNITKNPYKLN